MSREWNRSHILRRQNRRSPREGTPWSLPPCRNKCWVCCLLRLWCALFWSRHRRREFEFQDETINLCVGVSGWREKVCFCVCVLMWGEEVHGHIKRLTLLIHSVIASFSCTACFSSLSVFIITYMYENACTHTYACIRGSYTCARKHTHTHTHPLWCIHTQYHTITQSKSRGDLIRKVHMTRSVINIHEKGLPLWTLHDKREGCGLDTHTSLDNKAHPLKSLLYVCVHIVP